MQSAKRGYWDCIEQTNPGVLRDDVSTWGKWRVDPRGIMLNGDLLHCEGAWLVRGLPTVHSAFAHVWKDEDLIVSFDSTILWLPWEGQNLFRRPHVEGLHIDQNPFSKPGLCCVQGMVPLIDVTESSGGLAVVPGSHRDSALWKRHRWGGGDFCVMNDSDPVQQRRQLVLARAGDLVLWDSRTVHGGHVGTQAVAETAGLVRLTQTVCMLPRKTATEQVLAWRRNAFLKGMGTTHWPNEGRLTCLSGKKYVPLELSDSQQRVL